MSTMMETVFTAHDRCDRCGAEAKARHNFSTGSLLLCGHHDREYGDAMVLTEISVERAVQASV